MGLFLFILSGALNITIRQTKKPPAEASGFCSIFLVDHVVRTEEVFEHLNCCSTVK